MELRLRVQENSCRHSPQHEGKVKAASFMAQGLLVPGWGIPFRQFPCFAGKSEETFPVYSISCRSVSVKSYDGNHTNYPIMLRVSFRVCFLFRQTRKAFLSLSLLFPRLGALLPAPNAANAPGTSPRRSLQGCVLVLRLFLGWLGDLLFPKKPLPFSKKEARLAEVPPFPAGEPKSRRMLRPAQSAMADANFCRP